MRQKARVRQEPDSTKDSLRFLSMDRAGQSSSRTTNKSQHRNKLAYRYWPRAKVRRVICEATGQYRWSLMGAMPILEGLASHRVARPWEAAVMLASKRRPAST